MIPSSKPKVFYIKWQLLSCPTKWSSQIFDFWNFITHFFHLKLELNFPKKSCFIFKFHLRAIGMVFCLFFMQYSELSWNSMLNRGLTCKFWPRGSRSYDRFKKVTRSPRDLFCQGGCQGYEQANPIPILY